MSNPAIGFATSPDVGESAVKDSGGIVSSALPTESSQVVVSYPAAAEVVSNTTNPPDVKTMSRDLDKSKLQTQDLAGCWLTGFCVGRSCCHCGLILGFAYPLKLLKLTYNGVSVGIGCCSGSGSFCILPFAYVIPVQSLYEYDKLTKKWMHANIGCKECSDPSCPTIFSSKHCFDTPKRYIWTTCTSDECTLSIRFICCDRCVRQN